MARKPSVPQKAATPDTKGKRVTFDQETWQALDVLARERMATFQELADEAFRDLLKKHGRPTDLRDALKKSVRAVAANDPGDKAGKAKGADKGKARKRKPAGGRRAR